MVETDPLKDRCLPFRFDNGGHSDCIAGKCFEAGIAVTATSLLERDGTNLAANTRGRVSGMITWCAPNTYSVE